VQVGESQQVEAVKQLDALEASVHQRLHSSPAVMGSAAALQDLIAQQQQPVDSSAAAAAGAGAAHPQLQHLHSLSDSAMGAALRDAIAGACSGLIATSNAAVVDVEACVCCCSICRSRCACLDCTADCICWLHGCWFKRCCMAAVVPVSVLCWGVRVLHRNCVYVSLARLHCH